MRRSRIILAISSALLAISGAVLAKMHRSPTQFVYYYTGTGPIHHNCVLAPTVAQCTVDGIWYRCYIQPVGFPVYLLYTDSFCRIPAYYDPN